MSYEYQSYLNEIMKELIEPFSNTNIDWFIYGLFHLDENQNCEKVFVIDSRLKKSKWICDNAFDISPEYLETIRQLSINEEGYFIPPKRTDDYMINVWPVLGILDSVTMYKRHSNTIEFFEFNSTHNQSILLQNEIRIELKNIGILSKLKAHLSRKIKDLDLNYNVTLDFPKKFDLNYNDKTKHANLDVLYPYNHSIMINDKTFDLTKREWECWRLLALGQTAKTIGNKLDIKQRTAEHYINLLKQKTAINEKTLLAELFYTNFKEWI